MKAKILVYALPALILATIHLTEAQQPAKKIPRIGFLSSAAPPGTPYESFRQGLRDLGYVEGQNIAIEYRFGEVPRLTELATELVHLKVDLIVAQGQAAMIAKTAARAIPVVLLPGSILQRMGCKVLFWTSRSVIRITKG